MMDPGSSQADAPPVTHEPSPDDTTRSALADVLWILLPVVLMLLLFVAINLLAS